MTTTNSFYRKPLPEKCILFESEEGKTIFKEALIDGGMETYFPLASQFHTQIDPAYCGLGTLTMILNAFAVDPEIVWKGVWRWYSETMLDCCLPLDVIQKKGITFPEFRCIAKCNGLNVDASYGSQSSVEEFRAAVSRVSASKEKEAIVVSYNRSTLGQTGSGHYSPIGGYHAKRDLVLILDVARFKYPPHWVPLPLLFEAMLPIDPETKMSRGYVILSEKGSPKSLFCRLKNRSNLNSKVSWPDITNALTKRIPDYIAQEKPSNVKEITMAVLGALLEETNDGKRLIDAFSTFQQDLRDQLTQTHANYLQQLQNEIEQIPIYGIIQSSLKELALERDLDVGNMDVSLLTIVLLSCPLKFYSESFVKNTISMELREEWRLTISVRADSIVSTEVTSLSAILKEICLFCVNQCCRK